jgi:FkbM family methyltransferase
MKVFIDLGAYDGDSLETALKKYSDFDRFYAFEPLSKNFAVLEKKFSRYDNVSLFHTAADTRTGQSEFYLGRDFGDEGGSLCKNKKTNFKDKLEMVPTIDFSQFIKDQFKRTDRIILKVDIEGKEYDLFTKMIIEGSIDYISEIFCEWHWDRLNMSEEGHLYVLRSLNNSGFCLKGINKYDEFMSITERTGSIKKYKRSWEKSISLIKTLIRNKYPKAYALIASGKHSLSLKAELVTQEPS